MKDWGERPRVRNMSGIDPSAIENTSLTSIGQVRSTNQDYFDVFESPEGHRLLIVADGMGGHRGGATASRLATETIGDVFRASKADPPDTLYDALTTANQRVHQLSIDDPELRGMGTTVVSLLFGNDGRVFVAHVGDSRAYRLHAAGMEQITPDHSVVGEMVRRGLITPEEADVHPRRNEILRSVGVDAEVEIDVAQVLCAPGDYFVLCSDGLTGLVADDEIAEVVREHPIESAAERLVAMANARGGQDNITIQIAKLPANADRTLSLDQRPPEAERATGSMQLVAGLAVALLIVIAAWFVLSGESSETAESSPVSVDAPPPETRSGVGEDPSP
ncbi:MAG: Stp1/IreP family PP2C-type Ser/Thr phosphatase [bacterium]|nr:Stp1/IreP family PP2C-type Ser/Thr phosphatase [bacterium]